jgi:hypothetical protein
MVFRGIPEALMLLSRSYASFNMVSRSADFLYLKCREDSASKAAAYGTKPVGSNGFTISRMQ